MNNNSKGFTKFILIFIVVALIISYFGIDLEQVFNSQFAERVNDFWATYIKPILVLSLQTLAALVQRVISVIK